MAAGFKTATVNASDVPATQTNFPAYVDLSRLGITTLAEAESVRVYADSAKTTEWAREIVSATEMHVKVPSLTSTVSIYVDWDGVRSDYATTDTYGRDAVWDAYQAVYHMNTLTTDYTGNGYTLTNDNTVVTGTGLLGGSGAVAADFGSTNTNRSLRRTADDMGIGATAAFTMSGWVKLHQDVNGTQTYYGLFSKLVGGGSGSQVSTAYEWNSGSPRMDAQNYRTTNNISRHTITLGTSNWYFYTYTFTGSAFEWYINGASVGSGSNSGTQSVGSTIFIMGEFGSGDNGPMRGLIDEARVIGSSLSANWITTEHHNQSDEAGFWGTWTTLSTGKRGAVAAFF
jgi:hypothetical protein